MKTRIRNLADCLIGPFVGRTSAPVAPMPLAIFDIRGLKASPCSRRTGRSSDFRFRPLVVAHTQVAVARSAADTYVKSYLSRECLFWLVRNAMRPVRIHSLPAPVIEKFRTVLSLLNPGVFPAMSLGYRSNPDSQEMPKPEPPPRTVAHTCCPHQKGVCGACFDF